MTAARSVKPDSVGVGAVDAAREALLELVDAADVGETLGYVAEGERVTTHLFARTRAGYRGWRWAVTVARAPRVKVVTVDEVVLLPGDDAITAPPWVPYRDRIQPGDLGPGDLLPTEEDDTRLVPGVLLSGDPGDEVVDQDSLREVAYELGLNRPRVLSLEGRDLAAERWYDGSHGPTSPLAQAARRAARPAASWSGCRPAVPGVRRVRQRAAPTTTAGWSPGTTAAGPTPRRSSRPRASPSRCPTWCTTPSATTRSRPSEPAVSGGVSPARAPAGGSRAGGSSPSR